MSNVNLHEAFHCTKKVPLIIPLVSYMLMHLVRLFFFLLVTVLYYFTLNMIKVIFDNSTL